MASPAIAVLLHLAFLPSRHVSVERAQRCFSVVCMGAKSKSSFEAYKIGGKYELDLGFPLPQQRDAIHVHKKHMPKGVSPSKVPTSGLPVGLNASYPGLHVLHLDPFVAVVDNFFSTEECDAYRKLMEDERAYELEQSATFSSRTASSRTSTT